MSDPEAREQRSAEVRREAEIVLGKLLGLVDRLDQYAVELRREIEDRRTDQ